MKKTIGIFLLILSFLSVDATVVFFKKNKEIIEDMEIRAIYISYLEYYNHFLDGGKSINQAKINNMIENIAMDNYNVIILHVSPFSDSIYESNIMPYSSTLTGLEGKNPGFDYLDYFIKKAHQKNIKIFAWINPYRISFDRDISKLSPKNPAYKLLNTSSVFVDEKGIYYNPSSEIVKNIIINQVSEILDQYDIDGIHFDDYFYVQKDVDKLDFHNYQQNGGNKTLEEFRLYHTNDLIKRVYKLIKSKKMHVLFSIAPDGNINNNYKYHYADIKTWLSSDYYIDLIMPQLYYGFENEYLPFDKALNDWKKLMTNKQIMFAPVLAFYKVGMVDEGAGSGKDEWIIHSDLIYRQIELIRKENSYGFAIFRYDFLYDDKNQNDNSVKKKENLKKLNKKYS